MILLYAAHGKVFRCNCYMGCLHCRIKTVQMWLQLLCCCWFVVVFFLLLLFYYSLFNSMLLLCHSLRNSSRLCVFISLMVQRWFFTLYFISRRIFSSHIYIYMRTPEHLSDNGNNKRREQLLELLQLSCWFAVLACQQRWMATTLTKDRKYFSLPYDSTGTHSTAQHTTQHKM